jgi:hypothetical protein
MVYPEEVPLDEGSLKKIVNYVASLIRMHDIQAEVDSLS